MTRLYKKSALIILAAVLGGCSMMPAYQRPGAPIPQVWPDSVKLKATGGLALTDWQHYFTDPRLQALIAAALELSLIHISEPHETDSYLVCRLLLEKKKE